MMKQLFLLLSVCACVRSNGQTASSLFDKKKMSYKGTKTEQLYLLLRKPLIAGHIEASRPEIDAAFVALVEGPVGISKEKLKQYLQASHIDNSTVGGAVHEPVSSVQVNVEKIDAKYFVIHDVSTPEFEHDFPANINDSSFRYNKTGTWQNVDCHSLITRTGGVKMFHNFSEGWRATKFESKILGTSSRGLFLHFELVQPRVFPPGKKGAAQKAPVPGFTAIQYERLAMLYVCASVRKGEWLVPAFHICIDEKVKYQDPKTNKWVEDNHDDPQNFALSQFTDAVLRLTKTMQTQ